MKTIGECLDIRNVMEAARVYAAKHKMAREAQDACTRIVVMAERRIGRASAPIRLSDIGLTKKEAMKYSHMADLDDSDVEEVAVEARERGKPATKADFKRKVAEKRRQPATEVALTWFRGYLSTDNHGKRLKRP